MPEVMRSAGSRVRDGTQGYLASVPMMLTTHHPPSAPFFLSVNAHSVAAPPRVWGHGMETTALLCSGGGGWWLLQVWRWGTLIRMYFKV